jgi:hypothetical protein
LALLIARRDATADTSFAAILVRSGLGTETLAMIRMIATTIKSWRRENPLPTSRAKVEVLTLDLLIR